MKPAKTVRLRCHYSGPASREFWRRVNALPENSYEFGTMYHAAILLQELEARVIAWLLHFESLRVERVEKKGGKRG